MRILITGGAGFIGARLAHRLLRDGHSVRVLDTLLPQVHGKASPPLLECETVWADLRDSKNLVQCIRDVDVVYHLAAETGVGQSQYEIARYVSANTYGTAVLLEAAVEARVRHLVIASSRAVYGEGAHHCTACNREFVPEGRRACDMAAGLWDIRCWDCAHPCAPLPMTESSHPSPVSIYGITKLQQEQLAQCVGRSYALPVTVLRLFNVFGPGQSLSNPYVGVLGLFFRRAFSGLPVEIYEDGQMLRDFVFVDDVVEALRLCALNQRAFNRTLNVGTGRAVTLQEVASEIFLALELDPQIVVSARYRVGDVRHAIADVHKLKEALGFCPETSFGQGLRKYIDWARDNLSNAHDTVAEDQLASRGLLRVRNR